MAAVSRPPLILLPPSEGKTAGGRGAPWAPGRMRYSSLDDDRLAVIEALRAALVGGTIDPEAFFGVTGETLPRAVAAGTSILTAPTTSAFRRYSGVLYDALDPTSLDGTSKRRAGRQIVIVSGLFGLVAPGDPLPDYKLKMGASLPGLGVLSTWWKPRLTDALAPDIAKRVVWDLLPGEHRAAWSPDATAMTARIRVRFLDNQGTARSPRYVTVSHWNKLLKGALVRHILATQLADPDGLADFDHPLGYRFDPALTTEARGMTEVSLVR
jgi:cytoplasmic iron level regulating protein YaaA (DUF328/UPF0246 family)